MVGGIHGVWTGEELHQVWGTWLGRWYVTAFPHHLPVEGEPASGVAPDAPLCGGGGGDRRAGQDPGPLRDSLHRLQLQPGPPSQGDLHGNVPLMVPLSYTFLGYFAVHRRTAADQRPLADPGPPPVARVPGGAHPHRVGAVDHGPGLPARAPVVPGPGVPLPRPGVLVRSPAREPAGFALTAAVLLAVLTYMTRDEPNRRIDRWMDHPHLVSLVTYNGQILWLAIVAVVLGADEIAGSALLIWVPAAGVDRGAVEHAPDAPRHLGPSPPDPSAGVRPSPIGRAGPRCAMTDHPSRSPSGTQASSPGIRIRSSPSSAGVARSVGRGTQNSGR